jgi:ATP-dependent helicase/nuclease subunit A
VNHDLFAAQLPRELVLASAGSGKTFRISSRIIGLLATGEAPDEVFASTFTRKAAGEILARVLARLSAAALDATEAAELSRYALPSSAAQPLRPAEWQAVLERLIRSLHRLNIGTLDSFFVRVAGSFGQEAGLPPGWRIAGDTEFERLQADALDAMLRSADRAEWLALLRALNRGDARRSVHQALGRQAQELLAIHHQLDPEAPDPWGALERALGYLPRPDDVQRLRLAEWFRSTAVPRSSTGNPNRNWERCLGEAADAVEQENWTGFVENSLVRKVLCGEPQYDRHAIDDQLAALVRRGLALARAALGLRLVEQARALGSLAGHLATAYATSQRETGRFRFEDVTRVLGEHALWERSDIHYRLDGKLRHILLDEFQDTSLAQWRVLEPLLEELLAGYAGERAAVVVADPKQSIYGWRGGEPLLVEHVASLPSMEVAPPLATSWRSSQVVLDVVNTIFAGIEGSALFDDASRDTVREWARSFTRHVAARAGVPGHVRMVAGPRGDGRSSLRPEVCVAAAELVRELHEAAPAFSIGVLTRSNAAVARMIFELKRLGIEASEEGGNPLTDSPAVAAVLALFRLADHPADAISRYHVAHSPVGEALGYGGHADRWGALRISGGFRRRLLDDGYGATLEWLAARLHPACDARDARRIQQLVERGYRYDAEATLRPSDFARVVAAERVEDPLAARVRVMTVHQSKGLEFDLVVLPQLDLGITSAGGDGGPLTYRPDPVGRFTAVFPPMSGTLRELFADVEELQTAHAQRCAAELRDGLSTLYVAATRARHALHAVVCSDGDRESQARTYARLLRDALAPGEPAVDGVVLFESGDPEWYRAAKPSAARPRRSDPQIPRALRLADATVRSRMLPRRTPSGREGEAVVDLARVLTLDPAPSLRAGRVAHAWMEAIEWIEDGTPREEALRSIAVRAAPEAPAEELDRLIRSFAQWIARPAVRQALCRARYAGDATVERETPFAMRDGEALIEGIIDRLVLVHQDGRVVAAEIIDFKTDALADATPEQIRQRAGEYRPQLQAYRRAVAKLCGLQPEQVSASLLMLEPGVIVDL